jgi:hypothetical protein
MRLENVTEETVVSDEPDPWLTAWAAHLTEWEQGLRYSSAVALLAECNQPPVVRNVLRREDRTQHRTLASALGAW